MNTSPFRHWLATVNICLAAFLGGALAAPSFAAFGWRSAADALYAAYHLTCHQWAFRSFFLFGRGSGGLAAVYSQNQLAALGADPFGFVGGSAVGWKLAICERDLAIYVGVLIVGLVYARRRTIAPIGFGAFAAFALPMALDGFTQLFGWRESTWELRVFTGLLFGFASAWLVLPRLDASFGLHPAAYRYSPGGSCEPLPLPKTGPELSPRG
jgi:uncharacterized membrane protein